MIRSLKRSSRAAALALLACALPILAAGCGGGGSSNVPTVVPTHVSATKGCDVEPAPTPRPVELGMPKQTVSKADKLTATVDTSCGNFTIALDSAQAPQTVSAFVDMADHGVFEGTDFHRVVSGFVIQGGLQSFSGPDGRGYTTVEPPPKNFSYTRGTVAMAKGDSDPIGAGTGEFFVVTAPAVASLQPDYALIGKVSTGMSTVARISSLADPALGSAGGAPLQTVLIHSVKISGN